MRIQKIWKQIVRVLSFSTSSGVFFGTPGSIALMVYTKNVLNTYRHIIPGEFGCLICDL